MDDSLKDLHCSPFQNEYKLFFDFQCYIRKYYSLILSINLEKRLFIILTNLSLCMLVRYWSSKLALESNSKDKCKPLHEQRPRLLSNFLWKQQYPLRREFFRLWTRFLKISAKRMHSSMIDGEVTLWTLWSKTTGKIY